MRYELSYGRLGALMTVLGLGSRRSRVEVTDTHVDVRMGWAFAATIARAAITSVGAHPRRPVSRGVHGWRGRYLVNGSAEGLIDITIDPAVRARSGFWPVRLRQLTVGVEDPQGLIEALTSGG